MAGESSLSGEEGQRHGPGCDCPRCAGFQPGNDYGAETRFEEGNDVPLQHGVYSKRRLTEAAEEEYAAVRSTISPWEPSYELPVRTLAELRAMKRLAIVWLDEHGMVDDKAQVQPILHLVATWSRRETELFRELALTVRSRVELDLDRIARERGLVELAEVNEILAVYREVMTEVLPVRLRPVFLEKLNRRVAQLGESSRAGADAVEGSARRLDPGRPGGEEGIGR